MKTEALILSSGFQKLYCDAAVFTPFSTFIPISFQRALPFLTGDVVMDDPDLVEAEELHLAARSNDTRLGVIEAYSKCGLLPKAEAASLKSVVDDFDADFFELMGMLYANAGMFKCALRWYREVIVDLETRRLDFSADSESVHASTGYCLYSLGLFAEAIAWSKACMGPRPTADAVCESLIEYEAQKFGGAIRAIERSANRTRYTVGAVEPALANQTTQRLMAALKARAPFEEFYLNWISNNAPRPEARPEVDAFKPELDGSEMRRHKMNFIFATCGEADFLIQRGYVPEARRLLWEAALLEPGAGFIQEWIETLP
jgi:tetratricopeptide (TPR) repeat protein